MAQQPKNKNGADSTEDMSAATIPTEPDLDGALELLKVLVQKPKKIPAETVVAKAFSLIGEALRQGYSYTDLAKVFAGKGVKISAQELKSQYEALAAKATEEGGDKQDSLPIA
ncbi:hypothetical protein H6F67_22260 [Microcoleus sp. FACHB-1515]|uniref:hypothetical protein n=1 Tax=Cyanophyceae TaxID=3028117 RepID=UPI0016838932|nr:hypothetical protein [Microcoleus sp. FACHB-1515]MBD2092576.1 hypothetical protein [Microcoleus sp. FACHB-1515]